MKEKVSLLMDKNTWQEFKKYCHENGYNFSRKIEILIRNELDHKPRKEKQAQEIITVLSELISEKSNVMKEEKNTHKNTTQKANQPTQHPTDLKSLQERLLEKRKNRMA